MNTSSAIRDKLYDYIRVADEKKLHAIYNLLEDDIQRTAEWWQNKDLVSELDSRYTSLTTGKDKGLTVADLENTIGKLRKKRYGR